MNIFKNTRIFYHNKPDYDIATILVDNGKIVDVIIDTNSNFDSKAIKQKYNKQDINIVDCKGLNILPSCIDINLFPLDKNLDTKAIKNLAKKALLGGVSTIFLNPYTNPSIDNEAMNAFIESANQDEAINIFPLIANLSKINNKNILSNIDTLRNLNENARAIFTNSAIGSNYLYQTMQYAKMLNIPVCVFAFDEMIEHGVAYESTFARELGLPMITPVGQLKEVAKVKEMANFLQVEIIFMSMNIASCIDMVCNDDNLHCQVGLPHIVFSERDIKDYDTRYKILPPLLTRSKKTKLIKKLQEGKVELLTSMQSEVSAQYKQMVFELASESVDGLEHFFSLAYTLLVKSGLISMCHLINIISYNAARLLGLKKGIIAKGYDADFMVVDLESVYRIDNPLSLYHNMEVYGEIKQMIVGGNIHMISS